MNDATGKELKTGWYKDYWEKNLYFLEITKKGVLAYNPSGVEFDVAFSPLSSQKSCILPNKIYPTSPEEFKKRAQTIIDFINSKQSLLEKLTKS